MVAFLNVFNVCGRNAARRLWPHISVIIGSRDARRELSAMQSSSFSEYRTTNMKRSLGEK